MSYCKCGGYLGSGGVDMYAGRWCRCASPSQVMGHSFSTGKLVMGRYISEEELQSLESQLKEARELVKGLVECAEFYANKDLWRRGFAGTPDVPWFNVMTEFTADTEWFEDEYRHVSGGIARKCLKDNAEAIERLTREEK